MLNVGAEGRIAKDHLAELACLDAVPHGKREQVNQLLSDFAAFRKQFE